MSLKLRRGPDADRQGVTFAEGELVYVTDYASQGVSPLWIGDGTTVGGVPIVNPENPISTIVGLDDVDASTVSIGQVLKWDGAKWVNSDDTFGTSIGAGIVEGSHYRINIVAEDSTVIVNSDTGVVTADLVGNAAGNHTGTFTGVITATGDVTGDLRGSVFADNSSIIIDSVNNLVLGEIDNNDTTSVNITNERLNGSVVILQGSDSSGYKAGIEIRTDGDANDFYSLLNVVGRSNNVEGQSLVFERGRGTFDIPLPLQDQDELSSFTWFGLDTNTDSQFVAGIKVSVDAAPSQGLIPGRLQIATAGTNGVGGITIDSNQIVDFDIDNTVIAGSGSGEADISSVATYLKIKVAGVEYAMPLYGINP
jgi:hypothetical protein